MKVSYNWLQTFFVKPLPTPAVLAKALTLHSSEIDEIILLPNGDTVLDIKVLPDKSAWLMSHRGVAREIAVILNESIANDPLDVSPELSPLTDNLEINLVGDTCDFYSTAIMTGVKVGPSPIWLVEKLEAIGQRSINNIVDIANYVMLSMGQPLHAFDSEKITVKEGKQKIGVRPAKSGEIIVTLTGESYELSSADAVIIDGLTDEPLAIAGLKGGKFSGVTETTTTLIIESAHFNRQAVRKTSQRLKLRTDASARYENGLPANLAPLGLKLAVKLISEVAGGKLTGYQSSGSAEINRQLVACSLSKINSVLGVSLTEEEVSTILDRFAYKYSWTGEVVSVTPPLERDDLLIAEDLIEEIGRINGLEKTISIPPVKSLVTEYNPRHYYALKIRQALVAIGFSEIYTSSFREKDLVKIKNALAEDKGYLRSNLAENIKSARTKNIPHRDLLGLPAIKIFEIGTVFGLETEEVRVGIGVQTGTTYKAKVDDGLLAEAKKNIETTLGVVPTYIYDSEGIGEFSLDELLKQLPAVNNYEPVTIPAVVKYQPFSIYPAVSRDIAIWVPDAVAVSTVLDLLTQATSSLCVRLTHLDTFTKDGRTSYAFRLVFQSKEKTLDGNEIEEIMQTVYQKLTAAGFEVR